MLLRVQSGAPRQLLVLTPTPRARGGEGHVCVVIQSGRDAPSCPAASPAPPGRDTASDTAAIVVVLGQRKTGVSRDQKAVTV